MTMTNDDRKPWPWITIMINTGFLLVTFPPQTSSFPLAMAPSRFLKVCPIHLRFLISIWIGSCSVSFHRSLLDIQIARMRLMKVWSDVVTVSKIRYHIAKQILQLYWKVVLLFFWKGFYSPIAHAIEQTCISFLHIITLVIS